MAIYDFVWFDNRAPEMDAAYDIRYTVFCEEQGYTREQEWDDTDKAAHHVLMREDGVPVGTGRLFWQGDDTIILGRIAVLKPARGRGVGARLVQVMIEKAAELGAARVRLDSQCRVIPFYEKQGFTVCGEEHLDGHVLHRAMALEFPAKK